MNDLPMLYGTMIDRTMQTVKTYADHHHLQFSDHMLGNVDGDMIGLLENGRIGLLFIARTDEVSAFISILQLHSANDTERETLTISVNGQEWTGADVEAACMFDDEPPEEYLPPVISKLFSQCA